MLLDAGTGVVSGFSSQNTASEGFPANDLASRLRLEPSVEASSMRYVKTLSMLALAVLLVRPAFARQSDSDVTKTELNNFDTFLDSHPAIKNDLTKNPALVKDSTYLSAHPELKQFLDSHPGVREEINEHPRGFMNRERQFEKAGKDISPAEVKAFDDFLDKHPAIDKDLSKHPALVNDPSYLAKHPELKAFLNANPTIRQDLSEHPRAFMRQEHKLDKAENKAAAQAAAKAERHEEQQERQQERQERREKVEPKFSQRPIRTR
jgi:phage-related protein